MKKILIIDDSVDFIHVMKERLEGVGYSVVASTDAKEILKLAEKEKPDLIILDIVMPDINGYQVCERLKQDKDTITIPVLLLTGKELEPEGIVSRCLGLGVEAFMLKPVDSKTLLEKIKELIDKK